MWLASVWHELCMPSCCYFFSGSRPFMVPCPFGPLDPLAHWSLDLPKGQRIQWSRLFRVFTTYIPAQSSATLGPLVACGEQQEAAFDLFSCVASGGARYAGALGAALIQIEKPSKQALFRE